MLVSQGGLPVPASEKVIPVMRINTRRKDFQQHFENIHCCYFILNALLYCQGLENKRNEKLSCNKVLYFGKQCVYIYTLYGTKRCKDADAAFQKLQMQKRMIGQSRDSSDMSPCV